MKTRTLLVLWAGFSLLLFAAACKKKPPLEAKTPPPPVPVEKPKPREKPTIASFTAEPGNIERGRSSTLRWSVNDADDVSIAPGVGTVAGNGKHDVFPGASTTYTLTAKNTAGEVSATASVNVTVTPPPPAPRPAPTKTITERLNSETRDAYFDYDKYNLRPDARDALATDGAALKGIFRDFPTASLVVEGHCDERGSAEYNLGLGDRRAHAALEYLVQAGVPADKLKPISYGKERPVCTESNETCWQKNRRAHLAAAN